MAVFESGCSIPDRSPILIVFVVPSSVTSIVFPERFCAIFSVLVSSDSATLRLKLVYSKRFSSADELAVSTFSFSLRLLLAPLM